MKFVSPIGDTIRRVPALTGVRPKLLVFIDTEEEFDWNRPHSRSEVGVSNVRHQYRAQDILERYGVRPTYVVDYPVASQEMAYAILREWLADARCELGAHLHPWVNPPFEEALSARNSYPGNLPAKLEKAKLVYLTQVIEDTLGRRPTIYRAGRYGLGPASAAILEELGYEIDTSVVPLTSFDDDGGPDFTGFDPDPFWFGPTGQLLEIPLSVGWYGRLKRHGRLLQPWLTSKAGMRLHLPGIFARLNWLERIRLTPEGTNFAELKRLTDAMLASGRRVFVLNYHSPSMLPGNTPYVRNDADLSRFLACIDRFCEYFFGCAGGEPSTPSEFRLLCKASCSHSVQMGELTHKAG
jgi:hypothetical protein